MVNEQLYSFIRKKSEQIPVAIVRNSLIRHGYPRIEVDEAVRKVILEQQEHSRLEEKTEIFYDFGGTHRDLVKLQPTGPEKETEFVTLDQIKPKEIDVIKELKSAVIPRAPARPITNHIVQHEPEKPKPDGFVDIDAIRKETAVKVKEESEQRVQEIINEEPPVETPAPAEPAGEPESIEETIHVHEVEKNLPKINASLGLRVHIRAIRNAFRRGWAEIDQIKLTYFLIAVFAIIALLTSLVFPNSFVFRWSVKFMLGSTVMLMLAHNLRHLEKKYGLPAERKNSFELSVAMGGAGWLLSSMVRPGTLFLLIIPGTLVFAYLVKEVYKTTMKTALKVSALSAVAGFFSFYGAAIVTGVLIGLRALL